MQMQQLLGPSYHNSVDNAVVSGLVHVRTELGIEVEVVSELSFSYYLQIHCKF